MRIRRLAGAVSAAATLMANGCSADPDSDAASLPPGTLLTSQPVAAAVALPSAASNTLITYLSEDPHGQPVVVAGSVAVPRSQPPQGGWPVISWGHGTTGLADSCAPTSDFDGGPAHGYLGLMTETLDRWVARGYAVVATNYQGLGTPGAAPYSNGASAAHDMADIVAAARQLDSAIGADWVAVGHSQGGQAALFTAADANSRTPRLHLKGAVAIAPGSNFGRTVEFVESRQPGAEAAEPFLPLLVFGAAAADPEIDPAAIFTPEFGGFAAAAHTQCIDQLREQALIPRGEVFADGADLDRLTGYLARQEPGGITPQVPLLIAQGLADTTLPAAMTDALVETYCDDDREVVYRTYRDVNHRNTVAVAFPDARRFVADVLDGRTPPNSCAPS